MNLGDLDAQGRAAPRAIRLLADDIRRLDVAGSGKDPQRWNRISASDFMAHLMGLERVMVPRIVNIRPKHEVSPVSASRAHARHAGQREKTQGLPLTDIFAPARHIAFSVDSPIESETAA
jgi:hypothetical protein